MTNECDALACHRNGINAIGILLQKPKGGSKTDSVRMSVDAARALADAVRDRIAPVLLAHVTTLAELAALYEAIQPAAMQIQGDVAPADLVGLKQAYPQLTVIKTFKIIDGVEPEAVLAQIRPYLAVQSIDAVLLDSAQGGSGRPHDWSISAAVVKQLDGVVPCLLAGGLNASNVGVALGQVMPVGVDAMSSLAVENHPQRKDHDKLREFALSVRAGAKT